MVIKLPLCSSYITIDVSVYTVAVHRLVHSFSSTLENLLGVKSPSVRRAKNMSSIHQDRSVTVAISNELMTRNVSIMTYEYER